MSRNRFHRSQPERISKACFEALEDRRLLSFSPAANYGTIGTPSTVVTADFNNDGRLDLATCADAVTGSISVLLNNGAGGFGAAQRTIIGSQLTSMAVADFNSDGKIDIVAADWTNTRLHLLKGNGDGTFQPAVSTPQWYDLSEVTAGDFNHDGNADLLVSAFEWEGWIGNYQVQLGDGEGNFVDASDAPRAWDIDVGNGLATADFNNDGKLDVVNADVDVFLGNGDATLQDGSNVPVFGTSVATGDFSGDGKADVISVGNNVLSVLRGRGNGQLDQPILHTAYGITHTGVATGDFNADAKLDAAVTDADLGTVSIMLGNGDGTLRFFGAFATGTSPSGVVVGDFNADGRPDVAVSNSDYETKTVSILLNDGNWQTPPPPPPAPPDLSIGDVTVTEGNTGTRNATFTLTLSKPATVQAVVNFNAGGITAIVGSDFDYTGGSVVFAPGQTTKTLAVAVKGDSVAEPTETFAVNLLMPTNLRIADAQGIGTIIDDDGKRWKGPASGGNWSTAGNWSPSGAPTASDHISIDGGMSVNLSSSATVASVTLTGGATLTVGQNGNRVLRTSAIAIGAGSKLDLKDNDLIIDYAAGSASPLGERIGSAYTGVTGLIQSGHNGGAWDGSHGIITSMPGAAAGLTTIGVAEASGVLGITAGANGTWNGHTVDATTLLLKYTYAGDANLDGVIDGGDYGIIDNNCQIPNAFDYRNGDFNYDGVIDGGDYGIIDNNNIQAQGVPL